jgi:hypothetical protein
LVEMRYVEEKMSREPSVFLMGVNPTPYIDMDERGRD